MCSYNERLIVSRTVEAGAADGVKEERAQVTSAGRAPEGMAGLATGLAVIEAFGQAAARLTVSDAARLTNITRAAA